MIKNLKKLLPLAGTFLVLITLFCCDSTLIEDLDAIARKQTEGTYIYKTIIQKQNIDDNNYFTETETTETLNQPKTSTELKRWISEAINKNSTTGFILNNTPEVEHPEDSLYRLELMYDRVLYTLDFNENTLLSYEGTIPQSQTQRYEKQICLEFPELKLTNHMFLGWDENNTAVSPTYTTDNWNFTFYKDTTLYAIWQEGNATYTVYHYLNGLGLYQSQYTELLSTETAAGFAGETTTATAFSFPGADDYIYNITLATPVEQRTISADGTTEVFVCYSRNEFTIYLDLAGGIFTTETDPPEGTVNLSVLYGQNPADLIKSFAKTGYTFTEWQPSLPYTMDYTYANNAYTAQWTAIPYTLTYELVGGTMPEGQPASQVITIETNLLSLPEPTWTGYTFKGWYDNAIFADASQVTQIISPTGDITLYSVWEIVDYPVTYMVDGSEVKFDGYPDYYNIETETITALPEPSKAGYTFEGWYTDEAFADGTEMTQITQGSTGDITLYAKWEPVTYTITYMVDGSPVTYDGYASNYTIESETITALPTPAEVNGYTFEGWYPEEAYTDGTQLTQITQGTTGDITLYAKLTETSSGITYTTPDVSLITALITPDGTEFNTASYSSILFRVTQYSPSGQLVTTGRTYQWYLDGELKSTESTYTLDIRDDSVTAGTHILTFIVTDSNNKIATGTKQFVIIK